MAGIVRGSVDVSASITIIYFQVCGFQAKRQIFPFVAGLVFALHTWPKILEKENKTKTEGVKRSVRRIEPNRLLKKISRK